MCVQASASFSDFSSSVKEGILSYLRGRGGGSGTIEEDVCRALVSLPDAHGHRWIVNVCCVPGESFLQLVDTDNTLQ